MAYGFTYTLPTITGSHTDFPVLLREDDFPSAAIDGGSSSISNGGGNLRAYTSSAKTTQLPVEVVSFVAGGTPSAEVWVKIPTAATGSTIYIEADAVETVQPAVTNAYGRNAVWSDYETVYHLNEAASTAAGNYVDATGNGYDAGAFEGNEGVTQVAGQMGYAAEGHNPVSGIEEAIDTGFYDVHTINSHSFWTSYYGDQGQSGAHDGSNHRLYAGRYVTSQIIFGYGSAYKALSYSWSTDTPVKISFSKSGSTISCRVNGVELTTFSGSMSAASSCPVMILARARSTSVVDEEHKGWVDEHRMSTLSRSEDWDATEYANETSTGAWGTVGSWADAGGSSTYTYTPTGGISLSGTAPLSVTKVSSASGGVSFAGSAPVSVVKAYVPSGGIALSGVAATSNGNNYTYAPSGGITLSGSAATSAQHVYTYSVSGGVAFSGSSTTSVEHVYAFSPSGGIVFGGAAATALENTANAYIYQPSGGISLSGSSPVAVTVNYTPDGGISLSGSAAAEIHVALHSYLPTGGILIGGAGTYSFTQVAGWRTVSPTTSTWSDASEQASTWADALTTSATWSDQ